MKTGKILLLFVLLLTSFATAQNVNIVPYLKQIENGNAASVKNILPKLKSEHAKDPAVLFLDAVLTTDGNSALRKYESLYRNYPENQFADAALYRVFSYYYSMGSYTKASEYLDKLKKDYPSSPYIKAADRSIPDTKELILPVAVKDQKPTVAASSKYNFTIQAGAFLNTQNAKRLKNEFITDGYYSDIRTKEAGGSILNVVMIGRFEKKDFAESILRYLKSNHGLNGRVVPFN